ncbi:hypothetical protein JCM10212_003495 [Sporobolomyces blumeae]
MVQDRSIWSRLPNEETGRSRGAAHATGTGEGGAAATSGGPHLVEASSSSPSRTTKPLTRHPATNVDSDRSPRATDPVPPGAPPASSSATAFSHGARRPETPTQRDTRSPSRLPHIALDRAFSPDALVAPRSHDVASSASRGLEAQYDSTHEQQPQRPPSSARSVSFGAFDQAQRIKPALSVHALSATSSPFSPPLSSSSLAPPPPASSQPPPSATSHAPPTSKSSSDSTQPLLAEIFSGRPRPHFRTATSYSNSSPLPSDQTRALLSPPIPLSSSERQHHPAAPSYFAAPTHRPTLSRARSQSSAPTFETPPSSTNHHASHRTASPPPVPISMSYGAPGGGFSTFGGSTTTSSSLATMIAADQNGWRPSHSSSSASGGGGGGGGGYHPHFSASLPTTSAVGSPTFSSFVHRELSASPSSRAPGGGPSSATYSPFARPPSSLASPPATSSSSALPVPSSSNAISSGARPGALLSQSFSTGWEDFERERQGRARVRDTWGVSPNLGGTRDLGSGGGGGGTIGSPFSRDSSRLTSSGGGSDENSTAATSSAAAGSNHPELSSSFGTGTGDSTWGASAFATGGGMYKARRDYSLGAVGTGRKRSDSAWGGTRERVLRELDEDDDVDFSAMGGFAPPTKSGATSRRHSFAAFEAGPGSRAGQTTMVGFHLPEEVKKEVGGSSNGFGTSSITSSGFGSSGRGGFGGSNGLRMGGMGSSAIDDDDLAADLNSLHLSLDAHAQEQRHQEGLDHASYSLARPVPSSTSAFPLVGSMPVNFPPDRSRRFDTSRSPPSSASNLPPPSPATNPSAHGLPTVNDSPRATAEAFKPTTSYVAPSAPSSTTGNGNGISSVASRFFHAPSPLPPTTTNANAIATPVSGGSASRFDFGPPQQSAPSVQGRFGLAPPSGPSGYYGAPLPHQQQHLPPHGMRQGPPAPGPPALGSTFSPFAPSPYQSPAFVPQQPPYQPQHPFHPHQQQGPPQPPPPLQQQQLPQPPSAYFSPPPPSTQLPSSIPQLPPSATALTSQSQSDMNLGRGVPLHAIPADAPLCIVGFKAGRKDLFFCEDPKLHLDEGDLVIVEADRGRDVGKYLKRCSIEEVHKFQQHMVELALGQLANPNSMTSLGMGPAGGQHGGGGGSGQGGAGPAQLARMTKECQPKRIYAKAGPADTHALLAKAQDEVKALQLVRSKVAQKGLPMEILDAEWQWDRRKLTFYYTADQRVDFRELVRELFRIWKTRVWLCCLDQQQPGLDFV